ncbi:MAG: pilus assembly protein [Nitrospirae bacterium]|nr:MAG: pilus assembly protein [Nitrospirota bacterium]
MGTPRIQSQKGMATLEFAVVASMLLIMAFVIIDFGSLIQAQAVVTNISREGGSLASRDLKNGPDLLNLLAASSAPLEFETHPELYKIYIAKVDAGESAAAPDPVCTVQESGTLSGEAVVSPAMSATCDLPQNLYDLLKFDDTIQTSPLSQFTVVKVFYAHKPLTPLENLLDNSGQPLLNIDTDADNIPDAMLIGSTAIF